MQQYLYQIKALILLFPMIYMSFLCDWWFNSLHNFFSKFSVIYFFSSRKPKTLIFSWKTENQKPNTIFGTHLHEQECIYEHFHAMVNLVLRYFMLATSWVVTPAPWCRGCEAPRCLAWRSFQKSNHSELPSSVKMLIYKPNKSCLTRDNT